MKMRNRILAVMLAIVLAAAPTISPISSMVGNTAIVKASEADFSRSEDFSKSEGFAKEAETLNSGEETSIEREEGINKETKEENEEANETVREETTETAGEDLQEEDKKEEEASTADEETFTEEENSQLAQLEEETSTQDKTTDEITQETEEVAAEGEKTECTQKAVSLTVGSDETTRNITWYADDTAAGQVQYAAKSGDIFPDQYNTAQAVVKATSDAGFYSNQATLANLEANTEYVYRLVNGTKISDTYSFKTGDNDKNFHFLFVGDPQIGEKNTAIDTEQWENTLTNAMAKDQNAEFIISAGDQVSKGFEETQYAGYLEHAALKSMPVATVIGNHDHGWYPSGVYEELTYSVYNDHFNNPNKYGADTGKTSANSDYWYTYNNVLFMNLNSNDLSTASHKAFLKRAIEANRDKDIDWKVVVFHHSIFSAASHSQDNDILQRRAGLAQVFKDLDIDVVLMGHDHVYVRSYMMNGTTPSVTESLQYEAENPSGILYVTANSSSGSKYYSILGNASTEYAAVKDQKNRPNFSSVEITENSFKISTYYADDLTEIDHFEIKKTSNVPDGDGSAENPYVLKSDADLRMMAAKINENDANWVDKYYILDADIQMKSESFLMIDNFKGVLDGKGYTIYGLNIDEPEKNVSGEYRTAFIRTNFGTIKNLNFKDATVKTLANAGTNSYAGAAVVVGENANGGVISRVQVKNGSVTASSLGKAAGIAALNGRGATAAAKIENCKFEGTISCGGNTTYGAMMGGIAAYSAGPAAFSTTIENCYADAQIEYTGKGTSVNAAMICGYPNSISLKANVAGGGSITLPNTVTKKNVGRIYKLYNTAYKMSVANNIANKDITLNGNVFTADNTTNGEDKTSEQLSKKDTYTSIGWDFRNCWSMGEDNRPQLKETGALTLEGSGEQNDPIRIGSREDLLYVTELLNKTDGRVVGKHFVLTDDITLNADESFPMINNFTGVLDGAGHSILGMRISDTNTGKKTGYLVGFIRVNSGTIKDLAFESPVVETSVDCSGDSFSGAAVIAGENTTGGLIHGCRVSNAIVKAPNAAKVAGITTLNGRDTNKRATISNCYVSGDFSCGGTTVKYGTMMAGIASYSAGSTIKNCIADVNLYCDISNVSKSVVNQAAIVAYMNNINLNGNVAYSANMTTKGSVSSYYAGRIYGTKVAGTNITDNIAYDGIAILDKTVEDSAANGKAVTAEALSTKQTYVDLGWLFDLEWEMTKENYPIPKVFSYPTEDITRIAVTPYDDIIGFSWYCQSESGAYVTLSVDAKMSNAVKVDAVSKRMGDSYRYTAQAKNLQENTRYYYQICSGDKMSNIGTFRTLKKSGAVTFLNIAGTQGNTISESSVAADTMKVALDTCKNADFILHSGSIADDGRGDEAWKEFFFQAQNTLLNIPIVPTAASGKAAAMANQFNTNEKGYYSFNHSNVHIAVLDTTEDEAQCISKAQIDWLKKDIKAARENGAEWIILSVNKGPYTTGPSADTKEVQGLRTVLLPVIDELEIDLVVQGQDHILGRTYSVKGGKADAASEYTEMINGKRFYYSVSEEGTIYFMPGQAGVLMDSQITSMTTQEFDKYISLFSRSEQRGSTKNPTQTFASITVDKDKLTVCTYERKNTDTATMIEAFGIDKAVIKVKQLIADGKYEEARAAYDLLNDTQKRAVSNYNLLLDAQKEQNGLSQDGGVWLDKNAAERRSILLRNDTFSAFFDAPVRLQIQNAPTENMKFYTVSGEEIPFEIESYDKNGTSIVWVKVPNIAAESATALWVYFGGTKTKKNASDVWSNNYALVEHFSKIAANGQMLADSTGKANGVVTGTLTESSQGADKGAHFSKSKITYESIGGDFDAFTVSAVVSMTKEDMEALAGGKGVIAARFLSKASETNSYQMSIDAGKNELSTSYYAKWWREHNYNTSSWPTNQKTDYTCEAPSFDGTQHLLTLMYDGLTVSTYIDGKVVKRGRVFLENSGYVDDTLKTVIGAYSDETLTGAFEGTIYDMQISGAGTSEQWEAFRYQTYFGDGVTVGKAESNGDLAVNAEVIGRSKTLEAGKQVVEGILSKDAQLIIEAGENKYDFGLVKAGLFRQVITLIGKGKQTLIVTAKSDEKSETAAVDFNLKDTKNPSVGETSIETDEKSQTLIVQPSESADEKLTTDFYVSEAIQLSEENMAVAQGSTKEVTPEKINPASLEYLPQHIANLTTQTEDGTNPYQIYQIKLTSEQEAAGVYHIGWHGTSSRQVHAYAYDHEERKWVQMASTEGSKNVSMNIQVEGNQYVKDGKLYLLFLRALGQMPENMTGYTPKDGQYDFSMSWTSDLQYTSEFYEDILLQQRKWIADTYNKTKSVLNVDTGDLANAAYLSWEYNWKSASKSYEILENASVPYTIAWGNHDYKYVDKYNLIPNSDRLYRQYFPLSRFKENLGGWKMVANNKETDDMCLTQTIHGSKLMILTLSFWMDDSDIEWAKNIVTDPQYADYSIIILTHHFNSGGKITSTKGNKLLSDVIQGNKNVKLLLCGHVDGVDIINPTTGGQQFYSILQDYQDENGNMIYGGNGFLRMINFDVENNLIYFNTYSPLTGEVATPWASGSYKEIDGLYQKNKDEFAIKVDLGGDQNRAFTSTDLSFSVEQANKVATVTSAGDERITYEVDGLKAGQTYSWYAITKDRAGNATTTVPRSFTAIEKKAEPTVVGIEISKMPNRVEYVEGEKFDKEGMVVNAVYSDGSRKEITDYTVEPNGALTTKDTAAIVKWNDMTAQVEISVRSDSEEEPTITGIEVTKAPNRTEYKVGDTFDSTGMVVSVVYSNGTSEVISDYTYEPKGKLTAKDNVITITWKEKTTTLPITVKEKDGTVDNTGGNNNNNNGNNNNTGGNGSNSGNNNTGGTSNNLTGNSYKGNSNTNTSSGSGTSTSSSGNTVVKKVIDSIAKTADNSNIALWVFVMAATGCMIAAVIVRIRKEKKRGKDRKIK